MKLKYTLHQKVVLVNPYASEGNPLALVVRINSCRFLDKDSSVSIFEAVDDNLIEDYQSTPLNSRIVTPVYFVRAYEEGSSREYDFYYDAEDLLTRLRKRVEELEVEGLACSDNKEKSTKLYHQAESYHDYVRLIIGIVEDTISGSNVVFEFDPVKNTNDPATGHYVIKL